MRLIDADNLKEELAYKSPAPDFGIDGVILGVIDEQPTVTQWRRVENGLPKETKIVVTYGKGHVSFGYYLFLYDADTDKEVVEWFDCYGNRENVTHWMPLPEPPKEEKQC